MIRVTTGSKPHKLSKFDILALGGASDPLFPSGYACAVRLLSCTSSWRSSRDDVVRRNDDILPEILYRLRRSYI